MSTSVRGNPSAYGSASLSAGVIELNNAIMYDKQLGLMKRRENSRFLNTDGGAGLYLVYGRFCDLL